MNTYRKHALAVLVAAFVFSACSSEPEVVPSSGQRMPTSAEQVKLYQKAPKKYEQLGTVTVSAAEGAKWDDRGDATAGFDILKRKAAALGANGLLLAPAKDSDENKLILAGYHGDYYQIPVSRSTPPHGIAQAIYVLKEK